MFLLYNFAIIRAGNLKFKKKYLEENLLKLYMAHSNNHIYIHTNLQIQINIKDCEKLPVLEHLHIQNLRV